MFIQLVAYLVLSILFGYATASGTKHQLVRLFDVWFIGPFLVLIGFLPHFAHLDFNRMLLVILGGSTIGYNYRNYQLLSSNGS